MASEPKNLSKQKDKEVKKQQITKKADKLKQSLGSFNQTQKEPNAESIKSILVRPEYSQKASLLASKQKIIDGKEKLLNQVQIGMPGSFEAPKLASEVKKSEAKEFIRSGKVNSEIEEIKKEWLMEETKVRWSELNPFLSYEDAQNNPNYQPRFENAEKKWNRLWESDRDKLVPSSKIQTQESMLEAAKRKEEWIGDQIPGLKVLPGGVSRVSASILKQEFPQWYAEKEKEYNKTQQISAYVGLALKSFDSDLQKVISSQSMGKMESGQALLGATDPKKVFTAMTLDTVNFEDIASIGQDVYTKNGKIYYRGFEIDDQYLTDKGKQTAMVTDVIAQFVGGVVPYAGISGAIQKGVFALARAKDVPRILTGAQKLSQAIKYSSKVAPVLTELTVFNTLEEITDAAIRKTTGQDYTFNSFISGIAMGAGMAGTIRLLGRSIDTVELKDLVRKMETNVRDSKHLSSLKNMEFHGRTLNDLYLNTRQVYLKGMDKSKIRPGIDKPAVVDDFVAEMERTAPGASDIPTDTEKTVKIPETLFNSQRGIEVLSELQSSTKGERVMTDEGVSGISSSFPDWVPSDLRTRKLFDTVEENLLNGTVPKAKKAQELYNIVHRRMLGNENMVEAGVSKVGKDIQQKAIDKNLVSGKTGTAEYNMKTFAGQDMMVSDLIQNDLERAKRIINGEESIPEGMSASRLIKGMDKYALQTGDGQLSLDLMKSPLTSETSIHAQELAFLNDSDPFSPQTKIKEVQAVREKVAEKKMKGRTTIGVKREIRVELSQVIKKAKPTPKTWAALLDELTC